MNMNAVSSCYATWTESAVTIGNDLIERQFAWTASGLVCTAVVDKHGNHSWQTQALAAFAPEGVTIEQSVSDHDGQSEKHLLLTISQPCGNGVIETALAVFPGLPFVCLERRCKGIRIPATQGGTAAAVSSGIENAPQTVDEVPQAIAQRLNVIDNVPLNRTHLKLRTVKLFDRTDQNDCLAVEDARPLYARGNCSVQGNIFVIEDYLQHAAVMLVKEAPTQLYSLLGTSDCLQLQGTRNADIIGTGLQQGFDGDGWCLLYGSTIGVGSPEDLMTQYRALYRAQYRGIPGSDPFIMSNTWGDRSQDSRVCEDFMMKEIDRAIALGVDIIQIDDGWQKGVTANSKVAKGGVWEGYYAFDPDFWKVNPQRFPNGLAPLVAKAAAAGIQFGLWFSPDSSHEFANWRRDVDTILALSKTYSINHFKLDGVNLLTKRAEANYHQLLTAVVRESHNTIRVNLDCTAQNRQGYLLWKQFGTLFVENRYTDWGNYYPHNTLKNVWTLSHYLPPRKCQFELLNNQRNDARYGDDPLRPSLYDIDYEFASVMLANPLVWMEMSSLSDEQVARLQTIIAAYRPLRQQFANADIYPLGNQPDGCSWTGFQIAATAHHGWLLLFRENTPETETVITLPCPVAQSAKLSPLFASQQSLPHLQWLAANRLQVSLQRERTYVLASYEETI